MPQGGYSTRKGAFATQPFYWAIDDRSDATFYLEYMSERGWKPGVEYRYFLTREAKGAVMFDYFHDDKVDNGTNKQNQDIRLQGRRRGFPAAEPRPLLVSDEP